MTDQTSQLIIETIQLIATNHLNFSEHFYQSEFLADKHLRNLNKSSDTQVLNDDFFIQIFLPNYHKSLINYGMDKDLLKMNFKLNRLNLGRIRYRVKDPETIIQKLQQYSAREQKMNTLPVSKCLNDLQGVRLIMPNITLNKGLIEKLLHSCHEQGLLKRFYYRDRDGYKSFQCYFQCNSHYLPWELQIWDLADEHSNNLAHIKHEQAREQDRRGIQ
jgi:ppGpp synthetase/RelA/SpoT-type nucleotidyltranferase